MNANPETQHKVLILGNQEVGKTAIVNSVSFLSLPEPILNPKTKTFNKIGDFSGPEGSNQTEHIDQQSSIQSQKVSNLMVAVFNLKSQILVG